MGMKGDKQTTCFFCSCNLFCTVQTIHFIIMGYGVQGRIEEDCHLDENEMSCKIWPYVRFCRRLLLMVLNFLGFCLGHMLFQWLSIDLRIDTRRRELEGVESGTFPTTNPASEANPDAVAD